MALAPVPYCARISHDGREYSVNIPGLVVPRCTNCGNISLDDEANEQIDLAFRREARIMTPEQIRAGRKELGFNQQAFADLLGVAVSTLSRWETGAQIQQRSLDRFMRLVFGCPEVRTALADESLLCSLVIATEAASSAQA